MEFVLIRAGSFMMGDWNGPRRQNPVHKVTISRPYYLGKYEVTQEQWQAVMKDNPSHFVGDNRPVDSVSWDDCQAFVAKLNQKFGQPGIEFALPTEAQWEYGCRGGTTTPYSFGDDAMKLEKYAWFSANSKYSSHPVGQKKPNAWGLYDMHGNVSEWCADWFGEDYYQTSPTGDPAGPVSGLARVRRGGSCFSETGLRCGSRSYNAPDHRESTIGFRLLRSIGADDGAAALLAREKPQPGPMGLASSIDVPQTGEKGIAINLGGGVKLEMILVPAGEFQMGDDNGPASERPVHRVIIPEPFYLSRYEVTQEQWRAVMGDNPSNNRGPNLPVDSIRWSAAEAFVAYLNERFSDGAVRFSLPTEAQWEYACRAGTRTAYTFGDDPKKLGEYAWFIRNAEMTSHPVGQKKPNAWGLYDMHGNVSEWCADWYNGDYYTVVPARDPTGPKFGTYRALRGGDWLSSEPKLRCAYRTDSAAIVCTGFRVAATLSADWPLTSGGAPPTTSQLITSEVSLGRQHPGMLDKTVVVSDDGKRVAYVASRGYEYMAVVDGAGGKAYDDVAVLGFSPDGEHVGYVARRGAQQFVVRDGIEEPAYEAIGFFTFSPDSQRLAYVAGRNRRQFVVVDGQEGKRYTATGALSFSPDSRRTCYVAVVGGQRVADTEILGGRWVVVVDGEEQEQFDLIPGVGPVFSPDSKRFAYSAKRGDEWLVVVDGQQFGPYETSTDPVFSPDGERVAFAAKQRGDWTVVVDGKRGKPCRGIFKDTLVFSPDNTRVVYGAIRGDWSFIVVNSEEGTAYDAVASPVFSPDGGRLAHVAVLGGKQMVVVDGEKGSLYNGIGSVVFSSDGKRVAYTAKRGDKWLIVVDGEEGEECDAVGLPVFSPEGRTVVHIARLARTWFIVVGASKTAMCDGFLRGPAPIFDGPTDFHAIAQRDNHFLRMQVEIVRR